MEVNNHYLSEKILINTKNVCKITFHEREKCDWLVWCDERYEKSFFSKKKKIVRIAGFYDKRFFEDEIPSKTIDEYLGKVVFKLKELKDIKTNPYWQKFDGEYSEFYYDTEIFVRPYVEILYVNGTIDRYWLMTNEELKSIKNFLETNDDFTHLIIQ